jgi:hypothetical protein
MKQHLTPERQADLAERYPHESNERLIADFGLTKGQLAWFAGQRDLKKTPQVRSNIAHDALAQRTAGVNVSRHVIAALREAGPAGLAMTGLIVALPHLRKERIAPCVYMLTKRGALRRTGGRGQGRWFVVPDKVSTFSAGATKAALRPVEARAAPAVMVAAAKPRSGPAHLPGDADLSTASRTECPSPPPRFAIQPTGSGLFKTLGPGQYLDAEPSTWVSAITSKAS